MVDFGGFLAGFAGFSVFLTPVGWRFANVEQYSFVRQPG